MKRKLLTLAILCLAACSVFESAAAKDPLHCERDPNCAARREKSQDCATQCTDEAECMKRCDSVRAGVDRTR